MKLIPGALWRKYDIEGGKWVDVVFCFFVTNGPLKSYYINVCMLISRETIYETCIHLFKWIVVKFVPGLGHKDCCLPFWWIWPVKKKWGEKNQCVAKIEPFLKTNRNHLHRCVWRNKSSTLQQYPIRVLWMICSRVQ